MPVDSAMLAPDAPGQTIIAISELAEQERVDALRETGADVITLPARAGRVDLERLLQELGDRGINTLMVEGGAEIIGSLGDQELVDRVTAFVAPVLLGGSGAPSPIAGAGVALAQNGLRLVQPEISLAGDDVRISGYVTGRYPDEGLL